MASLLFLTLFLTLHDISFADSDIPAACTATRYPEQCYTSISQSKHLPINPTPLHILQTALSLSSDNLQTAQSMVKAILDSTPNNPNRTASALSCLEVLAYSDYRISLSKHAVSTGRMKDARAWLSASLLYQSGCWSGLKKVNDTRDVVETMSFLYDLTLLSSNALSMAMAYDIFGNDTSKWGPPRTERDGFWERVGSGGPWVGTGFGFPEKTAANLTVCKGGSEGCLGTVQEAVEAAPANLTAKFVIHIKEGIYEEIVRVPLEKRNLVFLGDGMGKTVITGSLNVGQPGMSTYNSATVGEFKLTQLNSLFFSLY